MKIEKGSLLWVNHSRSGKWQGRAKETFDTDSVEWFPIELVSDSVEGLNTTWYKGDDMPCRNTICKVTVI